MLPEALVAAWVGAASFDDYFTLAAPAGGQRNDCVFGRPAWREQISFLCFNRFYWMLYCGGGTAVITVQNGGYPLCCPPSSGSRGHRRRFHSPLRR